MWEVALPMKVGGRSDQRCSYPFATATICNAPPDQEEFLPTEEPKSRMALLKCQELRSLLTILLV